MHLSLKQRQKLLQLQELRSVEPTWVECVKCFKWRCLRDVTDPSILPSNWCCVKNTDPKYQSCDAPEEVCSEEDSSKMIFNKYASGSLVWARVPGYPWWPAMVDDDPDIKEFFWTEPGNQTPTYYHVVFLDDKVSRAWVPPTQLRSFTELTSINSMGPFVLRGRNYEPRVELAVKRANTVLSLTVKERLKHYSFLARYTGPVGRPAGNKSGKEKKRNKTPISTDHFVAPAEAAPVSRKRGSKPGQNKSSIHRRDDVSESDNVMAASQESYDDVLRDAASLIESCTFDSDGSDKDVGNEDNVSECSISKLIGEISESDRESSGAPSKKRKNTAKHSDPDYGSDKVDDDSELAVTSTSGTKKKKRSADKEAQSDKKRRPKKEKSDGAAEPTKKRAPKVKDKVKEKVGITDKVTTSSTTQPPFKDKKKPQFGAGQVKKNSTVVGMGTQEKVTSGKVKPVFAVKRKSGAPLSQDDGKVEGNLLSQEMKMSKLGGETSDGQGEVHCDEE